MQDKIIYIDNIDEFEDREQYLSVSDKLYLSRFNNDMAYRLSATGRYLLRYHLALTHPSTFKDYDIDYAKGKPFVVGLPGLHFSISHSCKVVSLLISDYPCGIDIQVIKDYREHIAENYFHPIELNKLNNLKGQNQINEFYRIWTYKEAYFKMIGTGLNTSMREIYVNDDDNLINQNEICKNIIIESEIKTYDKQEYYMSYCLNEYKSK